MQEKSAFINARFDLDRSYLRMAMRGSNEAICLLLGHLIRRVALYRAKVRGIPEEQALEDTLRTVEETARFSETPEEIIDLSPECKEG